MFLLKDWVFIVQDVCTMIKPNNPSKIDIEDCAGLQKIF